MTVHYALPQGDLPNVPSYDSSLLTGELSFDLSLNEMPARETEKCESEHVSIIRQTISLYQQ